MKYFSTSQARKMFGYTRRDLRQNPDIICLGAFPNKQGSLECLWTINDELKTLIRQSEKAVRRGDDITQIRDRIEEVVSDILGIPTSKKEAINDAS